MAKFSGTVRHNDLEGGFYELHTDKGDVYRLEGGGKLSAGAKVIVHGTIDEGGFGIHMTGPSITVDRVEPAG
jgi:formylmethanofuran dehydrogenase subunit C